MDRSRCALLRTGTTLSGSEPAEELSVMAHELAHELLHRGPRRIETTRQIRELEAEAAAYVVTQACGLENRTASWDYIGLYGGTPHQLGGRSRSAVDLRLNGQRLPDASPSIFPPKGQPF